MRYVYRRGKVVEADKAEQRPWTVSVISDSMPMLKHHGTGVTTDSKSRFRAETKACGAVELGNEIPKQRAPIKMDRMQRRNDIRHSLYQLRNS